MNSRDIFDESFDDYSSSRDVFDDAYVDYEKSQVAKSQSGAARLAMQGAIGGAQTVAMLNPLTAGPAAAATVGSLKSPSFTVPANRLAPAFQSLNRANPTDNLYGYEVPEIRVESPDLPANTLGIIDDLLESDREYQEIYGNDPDAAPPLDREAMIKGAQDMDKLLLGGEGVVGGLITAPLRAAGIDTNPADFAESVTRRASGIIAAIRNFATGGWLGRAPLPVGDTTASVISSAKTIPLAFTSALAGEVAQEAFGFPGAVLADAATLWAIPSSISRTKSWIDNRLKNVPIQREGLKFTAKPMAEVAQSEGAQKTSKAFTDIAKKYDIPVTLGTISDNQLVRSVENNIAKNKLTTQDAQAVRLHAADRWGRVYKEVLKDTAEASSYNSEGLIAERLKDDVVKPVQRKIFDTAGKLYQTSDQMFKDAEALLPKNVQRIEDSLNQMIGSISSLAPTSAESTSVGVATNLRNKLRVSPTEAGRPELEGLQFGVGTTESLLKEQTQAEVQATKGRKALMRGEARATRAKQVTAEEKRKAALQVKKMLGPEAENVIINDNGSISLRPNITPRQIISTVRSLGNTIEWENPNVTRLLAKPRQVLKDVLEEQYGATHRPAVDAYNAANREYAKGAAMFTGENARFREWAINSKTTPEQLANSLGSIRKFKQFEQQFGKTDEGKRLISYLKRKKLDQVLKNSFEKNQGGYLPGRVAAKVAQKEDEAFVRYLAGDKWQDFQELAKLDRFIAQNQTKIYTSNLNPGDLQEYIKDIGFIHLAPAIASMSPTGIATAAATKIGAKFLQDEYWKSAAAIYNSPTLMKEAIEIAQAAPKWSKRPEYWSARMANFSETAKLMSAQQAANDSFGLIK